MTFSILFVNEYERIMSSKFSKWLLKLWGWRIEMETPDLPDKYVVIVVPHTSSWDFPVGLLARSAMGEDIKYVGKKSLFRPPLGAIFRWLGGYPVDRSQRTHFVDAVVDVFNEKEEFAICIAPEGTRKRVDELKSGFYYIAKGAGIPIILCKFDWKDKVISFRKPFFPTDDKEADFALIYEYFEGVVGKKPEFSFRYPATK